MRCISHVALHFDFLPAQLDLEQIEEYLMHLGKKGASEAYAAMLGIIVNT